MEQDQKVNVRATGELLNRALRFNAFANWSVAGAQLITAIIVAYTWS